MEWRALVRDCQMACEGGVAEAKEREADAISGLPRPSAIELVLLIIAQALPCRSVDDEWLLAVTATEKLYFSFFFSDYWLGHNNLINSFFKFSFSLGPQAGQGRASVHLSLIVQWGEVGSRKVGERLLWRQVFVLHYLLALGRLDLLAPG